MVLCSVPSRTYSLAWGIDMQPGKVSPHGNNNTRGVTSNARQKQVEKCVCNSVWIPESDPRGLNLNSTAGPAH